MQANRISRIVGLGPYRRRRQNRRNRQNRQSRNAHQSPLRDIYALKAPRNGMPYPIKAHPAPAGNHPIGAAGKMQRWRWPCPIAVMWGTCTNTSSGAVHVEYLAAGALHKPATGFAVSIRLMSMKCEAVFDTAIRPRRLGQRFLGLNPIRL